MKPANILDFFFIFLLTAIYTPDQLFKIKPMYFEYLTANEFICMWTNHDKSLFVVYMYFEIIFLWILLIFCCSYAAIPFINF